MCVGGGGGGGGEETSHKGCQKDSCAKTKHPAFYQFIAKLYVFC